MSRKGPLVLWLVAATLSAGLVAVIASRIETFARSRPAPTPAGAIVVLGARVDPSGAASPALQRRAEKGAALYRQGLAPLVVFTGGGAPSEASVARDLAVKLGVPLGACLLEEASQSTFQNAQLTAPLLRQRNIDEVVLVSDGYHLLRAGLQFAGAGVRVQAVASERSLSTRDHLFWTLREAVALLRRPWMLVR